MKITLKVSGRKMSFSEESLAAIVEKYLDSIAANNEMEIVLTPVEGKWFEVDPKAINQKLFERERFDERQEKARLLILEAFAELNSNPEKYGRTFQTMMPEKKWYVKSVSELKDMSSKLGDHMADWVEQALEWAQRICNGESWEELCNMTDTTNWYRLIEWKNGNTRIIGGSSHGYDEYSATDIYDFEYKPNFCFNITVPLVVRYK